MFGELRTQIALKILLSRHENMPMKNYSLKRNLILPRYPTNPNPPMQLTNRRQQMMSVQLLQEKIAETVLTISIPFSFKCELKSLHKYDPFEQVYD